MNQASYNRRDKGEQIYRAAEILIVMGIAAAILNWFPFQLIDDAFISFRYAYNLAHYGELVFNLGDRTEGITNLLWTVILTLPLYVLDCPPDRSAFYLSLGVIFFVVFRLMQLGHYYSLRWGAGLAALMLILNPHFMATATNGLELPLYAALLIEVAYRLYRAEFKTGFVAAGLLFAVRPDGIGPAAVALGLVYSKTRCRADLLAGVAIVGSIVLGVTLFRLCYFGDFVPNSVIAKSFPLSLLPSLKWRIAVYLKTFFLENSAYIFVVAAALLWLGRGGTWKKKTPEVLLACYSIGCIAFSFVVAMRNGGDWMPHHRLLLQYGALYCTLLLPLLREKVLIPYVAVVPALVLSVSMASYILAIDKYAPSAPEGKGGGFYQRICDRLNGRIAKKEMISAEALGFISYRLIDNPFHDPLGLTDKHLARYGQPCITFGKLNPTYTLGTVKPAVAIWHRVGAVRGVGQELLDGYESFCAQDCGGWNAKVIMIRRDCLVELEPVFSDWGKVVVGTRAFGPPPD